MQVVWHYTQTSFIDSNTKMYGEYMQVVWPTQTSFIDSHKTFIDHVSKKNICKLFGLIPKHLSYIQKMFFHPGQVKEENEKQDKRPLPPPIMQPKAKVKSTPEPAHGAAGSGAAGSDAAGSDPRSKVEKLHAYGDRLRDKKNQLLARLQLREDPEDRAKLGEVNAYLEKLQQKLDHHTQVGEQAGVPEPTPPTEPKGPPAAYQQQYQAAHYQQQYQAAHYQQHMPAAPEPLTGGSLKSCSKSNWQRWRLSWDPKGKRGHMVMCGLLHPRVICRKPSLSAVCSLACF